MLKASAGPQITALSRLPGSDVLDGDRSLAQPWQSVYVRIGGQRMFIGPIAKERSGSRLFSNRHLAVKHSGS